MHKDDLYPGKTPSRTIGEYIGGIMIFLIATFLLLGYKAKQEEKFFYSVLNTCEAKGLTTSYCSELAEDSLSHYKDSSNWEDRE